MGHNIWINWHIAITFLLSALSASKPPSSVSSNTGAPKAKASNPRMSGGAPKLSNTQGWATCWLQVPIFDKKLANQNVPKRLLFNNWTDSTHALEELGVLLLTVSLV